MATYITAAEVVALTQNSVLAAAGTPAIEALILKAELDVDAHCGFWARAVDTQARLFPRAQDTDGAIPERVKYATLYQVEFVFDKSPDLEYGIKQDEKPALGVISPRAKEILHGYRRRLGNTLIGTGFSAPFTEQNAYLQ